MYLGWTLLVVESVGWRILCRILDGKRKFKPDEIQDLSFTIARKLASAGTSLDGCGFEVKGKRKHCITFFLRKPTIALWCINVILLRNRHRHVSATYMTVVRVVRTRIQIQLECVEIIPHLKSY